ncbi:Long-chain-fatty-acid--CoA/3-oxocholest-4-en-26-oate--CoA ligase [compost metagenome]|uniref:Fatty-acyl-CoA synthase n=1 Tax=Pseudomonas jinjuensis TaxID=198616 RepID=A0A1H0PEI9_9PSED|nr:AMP-binding protein [Pseudomonas jinjuensis]SDP03068.1 fatty-acyl-CoA synthase [Pseudomonas jinjuensis]
MKRTFNLADLFEAVAEAVPERLAIICGDFRETYAGLNRRADALAARMQQQGVGSGDSVGLQLYNGPEYLEGFLAACKLGAMPVNINYRYVADELRYLYDNAKLKALLYSENLSEVVEPLLPEFPAIAFHSRSGQAYEEMLAAAPASPEPVQRSDDDIMLLYTGGTTGLPKGVMWPHKALFFGALGGGGFFRAEGPVASPEELAEVARGSHPLRYFAIAPLMHGAALWATLVSLLAGQTVLIRPHGEFDPEAIWELTAQLKANIVSIVGDAMGMPMLEALRRNPGRWDLTSVMVLGSGGGLFSAHVQAGLREHLPNARVADSMGSSEGGVLGNGNHPTSGDGLIRLEPRADIGVVSETLDRLLGPGEQGILVRSGHVPVGYFGDPEKTAKTFFELDGRRFVNMGDRARIDADGGIVVLGRDSQCINSGGEKVHVEEVEEVLHRHPAVADAVVVGVPDPRWGRVVGAVIALHEGHSLDAEELKTFSRQFLAGYKVPKHFAEAGAVQRSPAGKADYRWALATLEAHLAAQAREHSPA